MSFGGGALDCGGVSPGGGGTEGSMEGGEEGPPNDGTLFLSSGATFVHGNMGRQVCLE